MIFVPLKTKTKSEVWSYFCYYLDAEEKRVAIKVNESFKRYLALT